MPLADEGGRFSTRTLCHSEAVWSWRSAVACPGIARAFVGRMTSNLRVVTFAWLALVALAACRSPQDPSGIGIPLARDAGTAPDTPEIRPDPDKPIGPIAGSTSGGRPPVMPGPAPSFGGLGGVGGMGVAGARVASN